VDTLLFTSFGHLALQLTTTSFFHPFTFPQHPFHIGFDFFSPHSTFVPSQPFSSFFTIFIFFSSNPFFLVFISFHPFHFLPFFTIFILVPSLPLSLPLFTFFIICSSIPFSSSPFQIGFHPFFTHSIFVLSPFSYFFHALHLNCSFPHFSSFFHSFHFPHAILSTFVFILFSPTPHLSFRHHFHIFHPIVFHFCPFSQFSSFVHLLHFCPFHIFIFFHPTIFILLSSIPLCPFSINPTTSMLSSFSYTSLLSLLSFHHFSTHFTFLLSHVFHSLHFSPFTHFHLFHMLQFHPFAQIIHFLSIPLFI